MRSSRFIAILVALMFAAVAPMSSAHAATDGVYAKARSPHVIKHFVAGEVRGSNDFFTKGQAVTYPNKFIKLQKKNCKKCAWKPFRQQRTSKSGSFRFVFDARIGHCFRLFVPGTTKYRPTFKGVGCIIRG